MNQNMKNKIGKLILGNAGFAAGFVLLYSPGLLGLRPSDPSIIKAALSITMGVLMPLGVVGYNYSLLGKKAEHQRGTATVSRNETFWAGSKFFFGSIG